MRRFLIKKAYTTFDFNLDIKTVKLKNIKLKCLKKFI